MLSVLFLLLSFMIGGIIYDLLVGNMTWKDLSKARKAVKEGWHPSVKKPPSP